MAYFVYLMGLRQVCWLLLLCRVGFCSRSWPRQELQSPHTAAAKAIAPSCYACIPIIILGNKLFLGPNRRFKSLMQECKNLIEENEVSSTSC